MNRSQSLSAADVLRKYDAGELQQVFSRYGEITNAKTLAQHIVKTRSGNPITTTGQLADVIAPLVKGQKMRYLSQLFQSLRIEINDEMGALKELLKGAHEVLKPQGKLVVISYHSLEDRLVKRFLKSGNFEGEPDTDLFGRRTEMWNIITNRPIESDSAEQQQNPRSRSAKMRIGEKLKTKN
jgi:16S rRNA (cytosine1402-N4)-methyltransferase